MSSKTVVLNCDKRFIDTSINCILGMITEKKYKDVFQTLEMNPELYNERVPILTTIHASACIYHILSTIFRGDDEMVREVAHLLLGVTSHQAVETRKGDEI